MKRLTIIKRTAAIVLFVTCFLPLSQCQKNSYKFSARVNPETGKRIPTTETIETGEKAGPPEYSYNIPIQFIAFEDPYSWLILLAFSWPLLFWAYISRDNRPRSALILNIMEPLACAGSGYVSSSIAYMGDILIWGYLSLASIGIYFISSCYGLYILKKNRS